ncbi:CehA/McbA family metallohydrolase [Povalibacter sp.]|uniref:CehA/McbA family metallohydrolase n=1 Tax=Povalibacter sp. TaxID=1962978 RepID=UPI002F428523
MFFVHPGPAYAARQTVLKQIDLPHNYYYREMLLPQLTSGPSSVDFSPDGKSLVYSMAGSLWQQGIAGTTAVEVTHGPGYDFQPDWSPDGKRVVFVRHHRNAIELWQLDLETMKELPLTQGGAVNLQPRYSPDGRRLAYVSTAGTGHLNLFVAELGGTGLTQPRFAVPPSQSRISRYYYSTHDHAINPSWTPDGQQLVFVWNHEVAYGSGSLCVVSLQEAASPRCFNNEETSWRAQPEVAPDGKRVLYSSYQGRQWHQLWLTTLAGDAALPLTFGDFDLTQARWSPDGKRIAYISNETGNVSLWLQEFIGGERRRIEPEARKHRRAMSTLRINVANSRGETLAGRISVVGSDQRAYASDDRWIHADDGFDPEQQHEEARYFHCSVTCDVTVPTGTTRVTVWRGQRFSPVQKTVQVRSGVNEVRVQLDELALPAWAPNAVTADLHVHMNYGGHYHATLPTLVGQASGEDLDVVYNTLVNKEQRVPDTGLFGTPPAEDVPALIYQSQEYHTSFWGHLGLLGLKEHLLLPGFSAYQHSALSSPFPHNGVIADLAHRQGALVGYVHPYDWAIDPLKEKSLTHAFPADVALGKTDYVEVVGFADHKATAAVWYRLLNLGFRVPTGAGTDAMTNYASLRGPVGMNRVYLHTKGAKSSDAVLEALRAGRSTASNSAQLALQVDGHDIGDTIALPKGLHRLSFRAAMRSIAPMDHLEVVHNGKVVAAHRFGKDHTRADFDGVFTVSNSGWVLLRAWNERADPLVFDLYPYATTSPVYVSVDGSPPKSPQDASYFVRWMDRIIEAARSRDDYNDDQERRQTLEYLDTARRKFAAMAAHSPGSE